MAEFQSTVAWKREGPDFKQQRYSRAHEWRFDGGAVVRGSSSPHAVPVPWSDPAGVDPEEAFAASVSSCHMLWFLSIAAGRGFVVDRYEDEAVAVMTDIAPRRQAITQVTLRPAIVFSGDKLPAEGDVAALHHAAHDHCYIANSIKAEVKVDGRWSVA